MTLADSSLQDDPVHPTALPQGKPRALDGELVNHSHRANSIIRAEQRRGAGLRGQMLRGSLGHKQPTLQPPAVPQRAQPPPEGREGNPAGRRQVARVPPRGTF